MKKTIFKLVLLVGVACLCSIFIFYQIERNQPVEEKLSLIKEQALLESDFLKDTSYSLENPKVILNPYKISPLTALIIFETKDLTAPTVTIQGKDEKTTITHTFTPNKIHMLPIYGLYPDHENIVTIQVNKEIKTIKIKTEALPKEVILPTKVKADKTKLNNEFYFTTPSSSGYTAAYDMNGDVRWYLTENCLWDIQRLDNGHIMLSSNRLINPPYYTTGLFEMDLLGKIYYEYSLPGGYHHDVFEMENGNLLVASDQFEDGTVEDVVVEIDRNTGLIVKTFDLKKILPEKVGANVYATDDDWFHNNSVWYDSKSNSITLSGRHRDAVINIDYKTGQLNWILGDSSNWGEDMQKYFFTPTNQVEWQWAQHAAMILPNGDIFLFDNGNNRSKTKENAISANKNYSRGVIYRINTNNMTIEQVWQYGKERGSSYYSPYISDVDYFDQNHYLIHSGGHSEKEGTVSNDPAGLSDVTILNSITTEILNNQIIFEMELPTNNYRAEKMSLYGNDQYQPGVGKQLGNMGITKTNSNRISTLFNKKMDEVYKSHNITLTKEFDRLVVHGTFKKEDEVDIILNSTFKKKVYHVRVSKKPYTAMCVDVFNEKEQKEGIGVTKYINDLGLNGKYYIYIKINGTVYDTNQYVNF